MIVCFCPVVSFFCLFFYISIDGAVCFVGAMVDGR